MNSPENACKQLLDALNILYSLKSKCSDSQLDRSIRLEFAVEETRRVLKQVSELYDIDIAKIVEKSDG